MSPNRLPAWVMPLCGLAVFLVAAIGAALLLTSRERARPATLGPGPGALGSGGAAVGGAPDLTTPIALTPGEEEAVPTVWVDVHDPAAVKRALFSNEWVQHILKEPLGRGFVGPWAAFLGTRGEDLKAAFSGAVLNLVAEQVLTRPFRVVWFASERSSDTPALIIPDPSSGARAALLALDKGTRRGTFSAPHCPGAGSPAPIEIRRLLLAEHAVYLGEANDRVVLGRQPASVLNGLCATLPPMSPAQPGNALELAFDSARFGREAEELMHVLGLGRVARLEFEVGKEGLFPRGLGAELTAPARLDSAALSDPLLKTIPEDVPVLLTFQLRLPAKLSSDALKAYWSSPAAGGATETRQVAVLWNPRGDRNLPTELAVIWSRADDDLREIFAGSHKLQTRRVCGQQVFTSTSELLGRIERACLGSSPSVLAAAPAVVAGLRARSSLGLGIHLGRLLAQLASDGYWSEHKASPKSPLTGVAPPEIEQAKRALDALPFVGFTGTVRESALVPGGFRS